MKNDSKANKITKVLFVIYLIALLWTIVFKLNAPFSKLGCMRSINLIPFNESLIINGKLDFREIIMNVAIFMPLGTHSGIMLKKMDCQNGYCQGVK